MDSSDLAPKHQAKQDALVAAIPPDMIERYVPQINILERQRMVQNEIFFTPDHPDEHIMEDEFQAYLAANPEPPHDPSNPTAQKAWHQQVHTELERIHANFRANYPEGVAAIERRHDETVGPAEMTNIAYDDLREQFLAEGGTDPQFEALRQAVLARKYSRPPTPTPGPALG